MLPCEFTFLLRDLSIPRSQWWQCRGDEQTRYFSSGTPRQKAVCPFWVLHTRTHTHAPAWLHPRVAGRQAGLSYLHWIRIQTRPCRGPENLRLFSPLCSHWGRFQVRSLSERPSSPRSALCNRSEAHQAEWWARAAGPGPEVVVGEPMPCCRSEPLWCPLRSTWLPLSISLLASSGAETCWMLPAPLLPDVSHSKFLGFVLVWFWFVLDV